MKVILLQDYADKGKTRLSNKIDEWLLQNNFIEEFKKLDPNNENANPYQRDFWAVYNKNRWCYKKYDTDLDISIIDVKES